MDEEMGGWGVEGMGWEGGRGALASSFIQARMIIYIHNQSYSLSFSCSLYKRLLIDWGARRLDVV